MMRSGFLFIFLIFFFFFPTVTVLRPREHDSSLSLYLSCRCLLKSSRKHLCLNGDPLQTVFVYIPHVNV